MILIYKVYVGKVYLCLDLWGMVSYSLGLPQALESPSSTSYILGLQAYTTKPRFSFSFLFFNLRRESNGYIFSMTTIKYGVQWIFLGKEIEI